MKKTILILSCLFVGSAFAEFSRSKCSKVLTHSGDVLIQRDWDEVSRNCFISLHPMDVIDLKYRDYYFDNAGLFMVFNSYGEGPDSKTTGFRSFYLFPIIQDYPDYSIEPNGDVLIQTVSGHQFLIDSKKLKIKSFIGGTYFEKPLSPNNKGGTEIKPTYGFWLDLGFKLGGLANDVPTNSTKVVGTKSGNCILKNTELYKYQAGNYNHPLLYSGQNLESFLQKRCNIQF
jgi:hypothetical protein